MFVWLQCFNRTWHSAPTLYFLNQNWSLQINLCIYWFIYVCHPRTLTRFTFYVVQTMYNVKFLSRIIWFLFVSLSFFLFFLTRAVLWSQQDTTTRRVADTLRYTDVLKEQVWDAEVNIGPVFVDRGVNKKDNTSRPVSYAFSIRFGFFVFSIVIFYNQENVIWKI